VRYQEFVLHRLHSLTGVVPLGLFLFEHFFTNSYSHQGEAAFNAKADFLRHLPYIHFIEIGVLLIPFAFHILYGLKIIYTGEVNVLQQNRPRNWLYFLQRVSAFPALGFILYHVYTIRLLQGDAPSLYAVMTDVFRSPYVVTFYVLGVVSICFHFANGLATASITWGLTISPTSQRYVAYAAAGVGVVLAAMAINSIFGFRPDGLESASEAVQAALPTLNLLVPTRGTGLI